MRYKARLLTTSICERDFERDTQRVFLYLQLSWFIYFSSITDLYMGYLSYLWYDNISNDKRRCDRDFSYKIFFFDLMKSIYDLKYFLLWLHNSVLWYFLRPFHARHFLSSLKIAGVI